MYSMTCIHETCMMRERSSGACSAWGKQECLVYIYCLSLNLANGSGITAPHPADSSPDKLFIPSWQISRFLSAWRHILCVQGLLSDVQFLCQGAPRNWAIDGISESLGPPSLCMFNCYSAGKITLRNKHVIRAFLSWFQPLRLVWCVNYCYLLLITVPYVSWGYPKYLVHISYSGISYFYHFKKRHI